ncbi:hypothetical protein [Jiella mangrovi]|uniref:DUF937 domain-containing protein n=1 Tax=Jiella mangrovi TaxID=2821407 RepID=A0ABS4BH09_9HYPH|nr:hypothetical protein [Jiella mangrovi]MBP0615471.1 hypothetical protein [Jiella mangrovi]
MTDFFDWLTATDSGIGADRLADAFKLSHQELRNTTTALAPAFALALQRAMVVPGAWAEISRHYKPFMDGHSSDLALGATESPVAKDLANALFGSRELVSAVSRNVSVASGVAPDTVELMIRNISVMTIGTMLRMMIANVTRGQPKGLAEGNYPEAMAEMLRRSANAFEAMGRPSNEPPPRQTPQMPGSDYLNRLFSDALTGTVPWLPPETGRRAEAARPSGAGAPPSNDASNPGEPLFAPYPALMEQFLRSFGGEMPDPAGDTAPAQAPAGSSSFPDRPRDVPGTASDTSGAPGEPDAESLADAAFAFQKDYARWMMEILSPPAGRQTGPEDG